MHEREIRAQERAYERGEWGEPKWQPMSSAPEDEIILLATTGGWVFTAWYVVDEDTGEWDWFWSNSEKVHPNHKPLGWMPLPTPPGFPLCLTCNGDGLIDVDRGYGQPPDRDICPDCDTIIEDQPAE